jgi:hypothetical protein
LPAERIPDGGRQSTRLSGGSRRGHLIAKHRFPISSIATRDGKTTGEEVFHRIHRYPQGDVHNPL